MRTLKELYKGKVSKSELFNETKFTFDYALPQGWLDEFSDWCKKFVPDITYDIILSTTIWAYTEKNYFGFPVFGCLEVYETFISYLRNK